jgi:hypothetical protein
MHMSNLALLAAGALSLAAPAFAQTSVTTTTTSPVVTHTEDRSGEGAALGAATGAAAGAVVGGPIGAAVGLVGGAVLGGSANVPEPVVTYVQTNRTETISYDGNVVAGATVPETIHLQPVPDSTYSYVNLNGSTVIVDPQTRTVVHILD